MFDRYEKNLDPPDPEEVNTFARKQLEDLAVYENYVNIDMDLVSYRASARESAADQSQEDCKSAREEQDQDNFGSQEDISGLQMQFESSMQIDP